MRKTSANRVLADSIAGADVFLGLSAAGVLKPELLAEMAAQAADHGAVPTRTRKSCRKSPAPHGPTQ